MKTTYVTNNEPRALVLPPVDHAASPPGPKDRALVPGLNAVSEAYWAAAKKHKAVKRWLAAGLIVEGQSAPDYRTESSEPPAPPPDDSLASKKPTKA